VRWACMRASRLSRGLHCRLVDHVGGIDAAVALVKRAARIPADEQVTVREVSRDPWPLQAALLPGSASAAASLLPLLLTYPAALLHSLHSAAHALHLQPPAAPPYACTAQLQLDASPQLSLGSLFQSIAAGGAGQLLAQHALEPQAQMPTICLGGAVDTTSPQPALDTL
jgi:hypothetical protein